ncbi:MAG TPA: PhnD/SsuA/transferrin family substrate-binding protein [Holophagaceae bacterium]
MEYAWGRLFLHTALAALVGTGCARRREADRRPAYGPAPPARIQEYVVAVHPLHNPQRLFAVYGPILDRLNAENPGFRLRLEASRNYAAFERKLAARAVHFALPNPYQTVSSEAYGYRIFGKMGDDPQFRGIILVRRDSGIRNLRDLAGKRISYPAPTALAATLMPQFFLHARGLDVDRDTQSVYVGTQESVILNVYYRVTDAGATWPIPWRSFQQGHPDQAAELVVQWQTGTLPNNGLVVRDDVPLPVVRRVERLLFSLHLDAEGRRILERIPLSRFERASSRTYDPVRRFMKRFEAEVRPLPQEGRS